MKRHSTTGPDAVYPDAGKVVILWLTSGSWIRGWHDEGGWRFGNSYPTKNVVAWSDPTEADAVGMVPVAWLRVSSITDKATGVFLSNDVELRSEKLVPLYATPPDTAALLRQAAGVLSELVGIFEHPTLHVSFKEADRVRAALAALRGALGDA